MKPATILVVLVGLVCLAAAKVCAAAPKPSKDDELVAGKSEVPPHGLLTWWRGHAPVTLLVEGRPRSWNVSPMRSDPRLGPADQLKSTRVGLVQVNATNSRPLCWPRTERAGHVGGYGGGESGDDIDRPTWRAERLVAGDPLLGDAAWHKIGEQCTSEPTLDSRYAMDARLSNETALRQRLTEGLQVTVLACHRRTGIPDTGHAGAALKPGTKVTLQTARPIPARVRQVVTWRERTLVRLVTVGADQADLSPAQRVPLLVPAPPADVENDSLPRSRPEPPEARTD